MKKEQYVLVVWQHGGISEIEGLYPNNEETFEYVKELLLKDVQEWRPHVSKVPHDLETIQELKWWYHDLTESAEDYWTIDELSPEEAPKLSK